MSATENTTVMQSVVNELKEQNPTISPEILRRTVYHIANLGTGADPLVMGEASYPPIMYAECQAYMDGFAAAIDGDYDIEDVEINPYATTSETLVNQLSQFGNVLPSYMLARASHYAAGTLSIQPEDVKMQFGDAIPAIAACGFVNGFSAGIQEVERGHVFKPVNRPRSDGYFKGQADLVVDDILGGGHDSLRELTKTYMSELSERKISTKSGRSRFDTDAESECMYVYGTGFVHGIIAATTKLPVPKPQNEHSEDEFALVKSELDSWCRMNGYPPEICDKAKTQSLYMIEEMQGSEADDGMYLLNGWGYADGYAAIAATEEPFAKPEFA